MAGSSQNVAIIQKKNWFEGDQVPPETVSLEETSNSNEEMFKTDDNMYESDESDNDDGSHYDDF